LLNATDVSLLCNLKIWLSLQLNNMKRWLLVTMVFILVLGILLIVISPYVDLPLTTVRACVFAVLFAQVLLLGGILQEPAFSLVATKMPVSDLTRAPCWLCTPLLPLLCVYLC
jgi:phosphate/sulfate permease